MLGKINTDKHKIVQIMLTSHELSIKSSTKETVYPTLNSKPLDPNVLKLDLTLEKFNEEFCNNGLVILTPIKVEYMYRRAIYKGRLAEWYIACRRITCIYTSSLCDMKLAD